MAARSKTKTKATAPTRAAKSKLAAAKKSKAPARDATSSDNDDYDDDGASDVYQDEKREELDSDALDEDEDVTATKKRKRASPAKKAKAGATKASPRKRRKKALDEEEDEDAELEDGMEVVGVVVKAPKTGRVPPGQISHNTFNFLSQLRKPECNDREWFKLHEPVYRVAEKEWKDFVDKFTDVLTEEDPQIPPLPPKDVIHRIYRDIRFSNDKTPYKTGFSASFSRSGRKGIFAACRVYVRYVRMLITPRRHATDRSAPETKVSSPPAHGVRERTSSPPSGTALSLPPLPSLTRATQRTHKTQLLPPAHAARQSRLRIVLRAPKPGKRQSVFGMEDELKVAPKGVDKNHKDIDLLKCRSFAVIHRFADEEVLAPGFMDELRRIVGVARPLVYCLNDYMTLGLDEGEEPEGGEDAEDEGSGDEEDA
ncbi:hypothetical protein EWM64_g8063 [Hericium alpestre]|uniref:Uncharacterized protein n=1 Tax=Hericium alpestre TaxID=135208 RepID=A0A4Y9ZNW3_9AGAM|nr:hypothetical protein EWM64_g8063 [Hericium alpestre]